LNFSKSNITLILILLCFFLIESTGFDFYAHSVIYYFNKEQLTHSYLMFNGDIILPRYGLLSSIYEIFSSLRIPLGIVVLFLIYIPVKDLVQFLNLKFNSRIELKKIVFIFFVSILIFFYSGLSISILYMISFFLTQKKERLLGVLFHPVILFLFPILAFFILDKKLIYYLIKLYITFFLYCFLFTKYQLQSSFSSDVIKLEIEASTLVDLFVYTYQAKYIEINTIIICLFIFLFFLKKSKSFLSNLFSIFKIKLLSYSQLVLTLLAMVLFIQIYFIYNNRPTLLSSIFNNSLIIDISWFSFGTKDNNLTLDLLMDQR
jgi:hypothetical protein